ncbi:MAG: hypothetical protein P4L67_04295 [Candidatus Pacebacteria bacterium]|nr:hypothetical protein [Candidatus Paceibacterota bacterium]
MSTPKRKTLKRPTGVSDTAEAYILWVDVKGMGVRLKVQGGMGVGLRRDNPALHEVIGEAICREFDIDLEATL